MMRRHQRLIASFTTLLVGVAVMACACGAGELQPQTISTATVDPHACCKPASDAPAAPIKESESCQHCGHVTAVPAQSPDRTPAPTFDFFAVLHDAPVALVELASGGSSTSLPLPVPPPSLLSLHCALRL
jgi:hypothetical protein